MTWSESSHAEEVRQAAVAVARFALQSPELDVRPQVRAELLRLYAIPLVTNGTIRSKYDTRYRSRRALGQRDASQLQHEHVFTRHWLTQKMQANPTDEVIEFCMTNLTISCTVTVEEHQRLTKFDRTHEGWERYLAAGVEVIDMTTGDVWDLASPPPELD